MASRTGTAAPRSSLRAPTLVAAIHPDRATPWPRHVLVASRGSPSSAPALALARELARGSGAGVELLAVFAPHIPVPAGTDHPDGQCEGADRIQAAQLLRAVRAQRDQVVRSGPVWPLRFESGDPPAVVTRVAYEKKVDLLVLGIGPPDTRERQSGDITPARAANLTETPLYAVAAACSELPRRTIVVLPERAPHLPTIRMAIACTRAGGEVWIALPAATNDVGAAAAPVPTELLALDGITLSGEQLVLRAVELDGELLTSVLALATAIGAQLIAVPAPGSAGVVRSLLPDYAGPLLLTARCSVLVVPDSVAGGEAPC